MEETGKHHVGSQTFDMTIKPKPDMSDSENDEDYVPPDDADSDSEHSNTGGEAVKQTTSEQVDPDTKKRERDALWSSFQASVAESSTSQNANPLPTTRTVKIERKFRFAGKEVESTSDREVVEVPEDSSEAKKWPTWKETFEDLNAPGPENAQPSSFSSPSPKTPLVTDSDAITEMSLIESSHCPIPSSEAVSPNTSTVADKPPAPKRPGPRRPKTMLAPLPGPSKAKKMTTLEKSAMDWKHHVHSVQSSGSSIKDELEANRRAGGYLEKVDFLKRVEERKEETLESLKSNKRRKI